MRNVVISQPMLFPWVGLFEQIRLADVFVHYDDVSFSKGSFVNRVQIKTRQGPQWLTIPLQNHQLGTRIDELLADDSQDWRRQHLERLEQAYRDAPFVDEMLALVGNVYGNTTSRLVDLLIAGIEESCRYLGIAEHVAFHRASKLSIPGRASERVLDVVRRFDGDAYITGHGAKNYLEHNAFDESGVRVEYMDYQRLPYEQLHGEFDPHVSILDLIANHGRGGTGYICSGTVYWPEFVRDSKPPARIPVAGPSITQKEIDYVTDAVTRCWYEQANSYHARFEQAMADHVGVKHAVALPSCTSAIHLALAAMNVGRDDEVIVPEATWIASSAPISYVGATPVFADIDPSNWCLSTEALRDRISDTTKAIIVVDLYGSMPDMAGLRRLADEHCIPIIEDAAEAFGSRYRQQQAGSFGDVGVFSFHGSKTMTTGEGGMLVTDDDALCERVTFLRDHGRVPGDTSFFNREVAYKYKMSSMQAALGLAQVERADELVARKRELFTWYADELRDEQFVILNPTVPGADLSYWMVTAIVDAALDLSKEQLATELLRRGIDTRPFFHPLSSLPAYSQSSAAKDASRRNLIAYDLCRRGINLPSAACITREQVHRVCAVLRDVLAAASTSAAA